MATPVTKKVECLGQPTKSPGVRESSFQIKNPRIQKLHMSITKAYLREMTQINGKRTGKKFSVGGQKRRKRSSVYGNHFRCS